MNGAPVRRCQSLGDERAALEADRGEEGWRTYGDFRFATSGDRVTFRDGLTGARVALRGEATLTFEGVARTTGPRLDGAGRLTDRLRLGAGARVMERELGRETAFGLLIAGRDRLIPEREGTDLPADERDGAERAARGAERPVLPREAAARLPPAPLERAWAQASEVPTDKRAAITATTIELHLRFELTADIGVSLLLAAGRGHAGKRTRSTSTQGYTFVKWESIRTDPL